MEISPSGAILDGNDKQVGGERRCRAEESIMLATSVEPLAPKLTDRNAGSNRTAPPRRGLRWRRVWLASLGLVFVLTLLLGLIQKWLWMRQLHYLDIFWTLLSVKWGLFLVALAIGLTYLWVALRGASRNIAEAQRVGGSSKAFTLSGDSGKTIGFDVGSRFLMWTVGIAAAIVSFLFALSVSSQWDTVLRFRYGRSFGVADPLFGIDLGFYFFRLPFYELAQSSVTFLTVGALAIVVGFAVFAMRPMKGSPWFTVPGNISREFIALAFILVANFGWGFYLDRYELVYSTLGVVHGAGYAAAHITRAALWIMVAASLLLCAGLAASYRRPRLKILAIGGGSYVLLYLVALVAAPALFENFVVRPSELSMETPYLKQYIAFTRAAYKLDGIQETAYPALADLTPEAIARNQDTIQNIRLWDSRPLLQTYQQTQAIRLYYQFYNVDVDRYHLADGYHQVMLASRELASELPAQAQTWVNENLEFTHGNGLVMSFVSKATSGGFPQYLLENIPPESQFGLKTTEPDIYYGENSPGYKIVATGIKEFDYPKGNENVYKSYRGAGGIPLDSLWKRVLFAWTQHDVNILLTSYLRPESKIQIWRSVQDRISQVAPFLLLDKDPYAVLSEGRQYWIQDAYTVSDRYPYSRPQADGPAAGDNYIRNSVKAVVDMYDGTVTLYVMDPQDPVLALYRRAFPSAFKDLGELSADLKSHLRYPEDLFAIQASQYETFHMTDPQVFYNREDLWVAPQEKFDGAVNPMEPYYMLMKLPGSEKLEYLIMTPFTPQNRDNMIAWLATRCDYPDYGRMLFYELPKEKLTYGPNQISAMIDQSTLISQQLTLWDQKGSGVIRGKLIVIPIENSFLYVVPLYLKAEGTNFPQLKRVIVATGDKVVMEPTLDEALNDLFAGNGPQPRDPEAAPTKSTLSQANLNEARAQLVAAQKAIQSLQGLLNAPAQ